MKHHKIVYSWISFGNVDEVIQVVDLLYTQEDYFIIHYNAKDDKIINFANIFVV